MKIHFRILEFDRGTKFYNNKQIIILFKGEKLFDLKSLRVCCLFAPKAKMQARKINLKI
jgi:hypothetical protein